MARSNIKAVMIGLLAGTAMSFAASAQTAGDTPASGPKTNSSNSTTTVGSVPYVAPTAPVPDASGSSMPPAAVPAVPVVPAQPYYNANPNNRPPAGTTSPMDAAREGYHSGPGKER